MRNQFHLPVLAVVKNKQGQILVIQRNNPKSTHSHLKWALPGGGIEFGEHPSETVTREVLEETGLTIDPLSDAMFVENHVFVDQKIQVLCLCYPARYIGGEIDTSKDDATLQAKWMLPGEIDYNNSLPKTREIIEKALKHL